jgi:hypothetical protein
MSDDPYAMTWTRTTYEFEGTVYTEWTGASEYHHAVVGNFPDATTWRGYVASLEGDQHSPYRATAAGAKAWCERYGKPKRRR